MPVILLGIITTQQMRLIEPSASNVSEMGTTVSHITRVCIVLVLTDLDRLPWIPIDWECKWLRPQAFFPNCWNGKDSYLPNNEHVRYPAGDNYEGGPCPDGFVRIPSLFIESTFERCTVADG